MSKSEPPRVFISHASEDKERFVEGFAAKLRERGIKVWYDAWKMLPGASLVDEVFDGIKDADVFIIVLSEVSVTKPWVREELNSAFINKIKGKTKIIPVLIEECEVPPAIQSILYQRISDLSDYDKALSRIVNAIFGLSDEPPLGEAPLYANRATNKIGDLTQQDVLILRIVGDQYLKDGQNLVDIEPIVEAAKSLGISEDGVVDSIKILDRRSYIEAHGFIGKPVGYVVIGHWGFKQYASQFVPNYESLYNRVIVQLINEKQNNSNEIAHALEASHLVILEILSDLADRRLIRIPSRTNTWQHISILGVEPDLKRSLK